MKTGSLFLILLIPFALLIMCIPSILFAQDPSNQTQNDPPSPDQEIIEETAEDEHLEETDDGEGQIEELTLDEEEVDVEEQKREMWERIFELIPMSMLKEFAELYELPYEEGITREELKELILSSATIEISPDLEEIDLAALNIRTSSRFEESGFGEPLTAASGEAYEVYVDKISFVMEKDEMGAYKVIAFGHCRILYETRALYADVLIVNVTEDEEGNTTVDEIMGYGDVKYEQENQVIIGSKFFFYPENLRGVVYDAVTYNDPFYIYGSRVSMIDTGKFVLHDGIISTCNLPNPHYYITVSRGWLFDQELFVGTNSTFELGHSTVFYFPFLFQTEFGTGIQTALGVERGIGFYLHNTFDLDLETTSFKFMLDYYQKMGLYFGTDFSYSSEQTSFTLHLAGAYSRSLRFEQENPQVLNENRFTNWAIWEVDAPEDAQRREHSTYRYKLDTSISQELLTEEGVTGINADISADFSIVSDPNFSSQFESRRFDAFDLDKLIEQPPLKSPTNYVGTNASGGEGASISFAANASTEFFSFSLSGDFGWNMLPAINFFPDTATTNTKELDFWRYVQTGHTFPQISFSHSQTAVDWWDLFFGEEEAEEGEEGEETTDEETTDEETTEEETTEEETTEEETTEETTEEETEEESTIFTDLATNPPMVSGEEEITPIPTFGTGVTMEDELEAVQEEVSPLFTITMPFGYGLSYSFSRTVTYNDQEVIENTNLSQNVSGNLNQSINLSYDFVSLSSSFRFSVTDSRVDTEKFDVEDSLNDEINSNTTWTGSWSNTLKFSFFTEYEYLEMNINAGFNYNMNDNFNPLEIRLVEDDSGNITKKEVGYDKRGRSMNATFSFSFLKTSFNITGFFNRQLYLTPNEELETIIGFRTRDDILYDDNHPPISISISTQIVPNLTISESYTETMKLRGDHGGLFKGRPDSNSLSISYTIPTRWVIIEEIIFDSINLGSSWTHNFQSPKNSNLTLNLSLSFTLFSNWNFSMNTSVKNSELYLYFPEDARKYGEEPKNFFMDLLRSFNIFDVEDLQETSFINGGVSFSISHNLHDWDLVATFAIAPITYNGITYFDPSFSMEVHLRKMPSFKPNPIRYDNPRR